MFYQHISANDFSSSAAKPSEYKAERAITEIQSLKFDIERLLMITEALWTLLREQHGYSEDVLLNKITEMDMRDGRMDGKVAASAPFNCPKCSRPLGKRRPACIYCGTPVVWDPFER